MKAKLNIVAALLLAATLSTPTFAQSSKAVAKVNGVSISAGMADEMRNAQIAQGVPNSPDLQKAVVTELVRRETLAQEAKKKGLDKQATTQARLELARQSVLFGVYLEDWAKAHPVADAQVRAEYDRLVKQMGDKEYKVRHIVVDKEEDAQAIIKKLQGGAKFSDLAKDSKDVSNKDNGGDLGWVNPASMVQPFGEALAKLDKGKFTTQPVKTQFGYHVIMLDDVRKSDPPKFDDVKPRIQQGLEQQAIQKQIDELVSKAKIE